jgi:hypothetical protein
MNEPEFALLTEKYLDGTLTPAERRELVEFLLAHRDRQHDFAEQVRQHLRLTAQMRPCDRAEARKTAEIILDVIEKESLPASRVRPPVITEPTFRETIRAVWHGLRAPRDSGEYKFARFMLWRLCGPGPLAVGLSLLLIFLLINFVVEERNRPPDEGITVILRDTPEVVPGAEALTENLPNIPIERPTLEPTVDSKLTDPSAAGALADTESLSTPVPDKDDSVSLAIGMSPRLNPSTRILAHVAPGRTGPGRQDALRKYDAPPGLEKAVLKALYWLKEQQRPDGAWDGTDRAAMTGLALLTFLAHGETPSSGEFGGTVERAIRYLLGIQRPDGSFSANEYAHAIAVTAIGEASAMTRIMILGEATDRGLGVILRGQQDSGGYDYGYGKGGRSDTSVTGWQLQAMKSAVLAGNTDTRLAASINRGVDFLKRQAWASDGSGFVYASIPGQSAGAGGTWSMTAVGSLCLSLLAHQEQGGLIRQSLKRLELSYPPWDAADQKKPVYSWYYATQAKFHAGGHDWSEWNHHFARDLMTSQKGDGHWEGGDHDSGSHVYTTTLSTLMLEVYYRYLPSYAWNSKGGVGEKDLSSEVNVEVR